MQSANIQWDQIICTMQIQRKIIIIFYLLHSFLVKDDLWNIQPPLTVNKCYDLAWCAESWLEGEHKFPPHSGKQMIFSSSNQFNCHGSSFRGSGSSRESGCSGGGGGSIAVQVKGGDHYCQWLLMIMIRNGNN